MMSFILFFLFLLDNGWSTDHIQVGNNFSEEVKLCEDGQEDEACNSGGEHGGDGQGDFEEEEGSGRREVNWTWRFVLSLLCQVSMCPTHQHSIETLKSSCGLLLVFSTRHGILWQLSHLPACFLPERFLLHSQASLTLP